MADKSIVSNSKLTAIANAIRSKTGSTETLTLDTMVTKIQSIGGAGIVPTGTIDITANGTYDVTNYASAKVNVEDVEDPFITLVNSKSSYKCYYLFCNSNFTNLDVYLDKIDISDVIYCNNMFYNCSNLLGEIELDIPSAEYAQSMFSNCRKLTSIILRNTSNLTSLMYTFSGCSALTQLSSLNTNNVSEMRSAFAYCYLLKTIDISSMDKVTATTSGDMCRNCYSLTKLIIRTMTKVPPLNSNAFNNCYHFTGTVNTTYNPSGLKDGRIYVPDNMVDTLKSATNWSTYADIIVPLSTLVED